MNSKLFGSGVAVGVLVGNGVNVGMGLGVSVGVMIGVLVANTLELPLDDSVPVSVSVSALPASTMPSGVAVGGMTKTSGISNSDQTGLKISSYSVRVSLASLYWM